MIMPQVTFTTGYTKQDRYLLHHTLFKGCRLVYEQLAPLVGMQADMMYSGLQVQFTDTISQELKDYGAIGLSWRDRNLNFMPAKMSQRDFHIYSGVFMMELTHSIVDRLSNDRRMSNDLIHWLYNMQMVETKSYLNVLSLLKWHDVVKMLLPHMAYGWINRQQIMAGIISGEYKEGIHQYWSDPAWHGDVRQPIPASEHELEQIKSLFG